MALCCSESVGETCECHVNSRISCYCATGEPPSTCQSPEYRTTGRKASSSDACRRGCSFGFVGRSLFCHELRKDRVETRRHASFQLNLQPGGLTDRSAARPSSRGRRPGRLPPCRKPTE